MRYRVEVELAVWYSRTETTYLIVEADHEADVQQLCDEHLDADELANGKGPGTLMYADLPGLRIMGAAYHDSEALERNEAEITDTRIRTIVEEEN